MRLCSCASRSSARISILSCGVDKWCRCHHPAHSAAEDEDQFKRLHALGSSSGHLACRLRPRSCARRGEFGAEESGLRFKSTKTEKGRAVALPSFVVAELRAWKVEVAQELLKQGVRLTGDTLVCARADGEPHQPRSLTHEWTRMLSRMKDIPRVRFHDLRHSHATQLLAAGVHPKIAQERLGHSTIVTTLDLCSHVSDTMQTEAAAKIDATLGTGLRAT